MLEGDAGDAPRRIAVEDIEARAAHSAEHRAYALADALVGGQTASATRSYLRLREQGERLAGLTYLIAGRLRDALSISLRLSAGESAADVKRGLRMPARAADRLVAEVARSDPDRYRRALAALARMELDSRGGAVLTAERGAQANMAEDTISQLAIEEMA